MAAASLYGFSRHDSKRDAILWRCPGNSEILKIVSRFEDCQA